MIIEKATMLVISHKDWEMPKFVLVETDAENGERLSDIAERAFEKLKPTLEDGTQLLDYSYYGEVEVPAADKKEE